MRIYTFDPQTGEYTGQMEAPKCPVTGADVLPAWTTATTPPIVGETQVARYVEAFLGDPAGHWIVEEMPQPMPDPEPTPEEIEDTAWAALRAERNARLAMCDWAQLADAPLTGEQKAAWQAYRQVLRDLPENTIDPTRPEWPELPA
ncbi:MAG TPA: tail fiber assembly protein [Selenomonadales bacterium]|nr:tail fiber assembly protein [Selenomonadales bacterium]